MSTVFWLIHGALLLAAAISDLRRFIIPNSICFALVALFALRTAAFGPPDAFPLDHILVAMTAFGIGAGLFFARLWGAGDAKLLAATMLWLEWHDTSRFLLIMALAGGILACLCLVAARCRNGLHPNKPAAIPYGCAIALAAADQWIRQLPISVE